MIKDLTIGRLLKLREQLSFVIGKLLFDKTTANYQPSSTINSVLFIRGDGKLGDSIVSSFVYREMKACKPSLNIGVLCTPNSEHIFNNDPFIDNVHCYPKRAKIWKVNSLIRQLPNYDAVVFLTEVLKPRDFLMLRCLNAKAVVGLLPNIGLINVNIQKLVHGKHSQDYFVESARALGFELSDLSYRFNLPDKVEQEILHFLGDRKGHYIALNPAGNTTKRTFTAKRLREVAYALRDRFNELPLVILASPANQQLVNEISADIDGVFCFCETKSFEQNAALIKHCKALVSVDTATVHLANVYNKPLLAIYRQDPDNYKKWSPNYSKAITLFTRAAVNEYEEVNIGEFELAKFLDEVTILLNKA
ncbi:hypothetical protein F9L16_20205 [Agarivorans sp. B2Z047]|uniref:glycosyltransferase family 9 protein n=1 Tax=Agarivorans sp. B2Z047 TaxID=2652721 RepID=UPI00128BCF68|nr:glycosyltransferase family 9 protein [Agarivorans sp. B2Z047]MPW31301.1 hypothetical protein [Agarivorans sp. B2Z047]UQN42735.1 glycosyltransferase family 9 protein [Agarivorans sp. B2Z047]